MSRLILSFFSFLSFYLLRTSTALAAWTPLIQATDFDGIRTDVLTTVSGIITIFLILAGLGLLIRTIGR